MATSLCRVVSKANKIDTHAVLADLVVKVVAVDDICLDFKNH
jgi:hypothetical protein